MGLDIKKAKKNGIQREKKGNGGWNEMINGGRGTGKEKPREKR